MGHPRLWRVPWRVAWGLHRRQTDRYTMHREVGYRVYLMGYRGEREGGRGERGEGGRKQRGREREATSSEEEQEERAGWKGGGTCLMERGEWAELVS